ncbi:MAG: ribosome biogenesis GTPase Der [Planctomycetes bacterium]|nr:ribosome biogenesis GTPase Der [Planctomycetota bacterium]
MTDDSNKRLARVCLVGRPNVGKSTLLNRMCGSRVSIVEPTAGVTRDRIAVQARLFRGRHERWVEVIDTGGVGIVDRDDLGPHVEEQVSTAIGSADLVLFLVDGRDGITPLDRKVADSLRGAGLPVILCVNKIESEELEWGTDEFRRLGVGDGPFPISAQNAEGLTEVYEQVIEHLGSDRFLEKPPEEERPTMKLAVVGRRNAGKSTLINQLAREERMIVSEIPGTTRDSVDVVFERDGKRFVAIDTAGVRKKKSIADAIEFYSDTRSYRAIRRADVVVILFDMTEPISAIEKKLARYVMDHHSPVVIAANKWDLSERTLKEFREDLDLHLRGLSWAPFVKLSAKKGKGIDQLVEKAEGLFEQGQQRVGTGELNRVLERALTARVPNSKGYRAKIHYATQAEVSPPTFVLFVNDKKLFTKDYIRYLSNRLRKELPFEDVPVRIVLREKDKDRETKERTGPIS